MAIRLNQKLNVKIAGMERVNIQGLIPMDILCGAMQNMSNYYRFGYTVRIEEIQVDKRPVTYGLSFNLPRHSVLYLVPYQIPGGTTYELYRNFKAPKGTMESAEEEKLFLKSVEYGMLDVLMPGYRKDAAMVQNQGMGTNPVQPQLQYSQPQNYQQAQPQYSQPQNYQQAQPQYEQAQPQYSQPIQSQYEPAQPQQSQDSLFSLPEVDMSSFGSNTFISHDTNTDNFFDDL